MSYQERVVSDFSALESQKENITRLRQGRSAAQLSERFNTHDSGIDRQRLKFEKQIIEEIESVDDPLEIYLNYIHWIRDNFPQGVTAKKSGMLELLERCLQYFKTDELYTNDPRYIKLWIWYIEIFIPKIEEKRDMFYYMLRHNIGLKLAVLYETFSNVLWDLSSYEEAIKMLENGVASKCRPVKRVQQQLEIFQRDYKNIKPKNTVSLEDNSGASVLGQSKRDIVAGTSQPGNLGMQSDKKKLTIYADDNDDSKTNTAISALLNSNNENFPSKHVISKENKKNTDSLIHGTKLVPLVTIEEQRKRKLENAAILDKPKTTVFNDLKQTLEPKYKYFDVPGKKPERIEVNYDLIYQGSNELCFEEILAIKRKGRKKPEKKVKKRKILESKPVIRTSIMPLKDETIQLKSPLKGSLDSSIKAAPASPTVTMFSKNAVNEIFSMFNQPGSTNDNLLSFSHPTLEEDNTEKKFELFENFTQDFTKKSLDDLTEVKLTTALLQRTPKSKGQTNNIKTYMTPLNDFQILKNNSSPLKPNVASTNTKSSPRHDIGPSKINIIEDPLNESFRNHLLSSAKPLTTYENFHQYNYDLKMSGQLSRINKTISKKTTNKNPIINFQKTDDLYCIRGELGRGGFATVYLAESGDGILKALKVEKPSNLWEFYILKQISERLRERQYILNSIILVDSLHIFRDESYLVLNYISQGTILDLVNLERNKNGNGQGLNELLTVFFTIEIIKVVECLHQIGILHGDLKPDNCMIKFEKSNKPLGEYNSLGQNNWDQKGIYLIDFGRSFDLSILPPGTKFKANWKCDDQDCSEMREQKPWNYESDYYGLAGIIHCMLFGDFIKTVKVGEKYKLFNGFKRYWQKPMWEELFDILLNSGQHNHGIWPLNAVLRQQKNKLEEFLKQGTNSNKLQNIIHELELDLG